MGLSNSTTLEVPHDEARKPFTEEPAVHLPIRAAPRKGPLRQNPHSARGTSEHVAGT